MHTFRWAAVMKTIVRKKNPKLLPLLDSIIEQTRFILCVIKFEQNDRAGGR
jgi:hypothetical protein